MNGYDSDAIRFVARVVFWVLAAPAMLSVGIGLITMTSRIEQGLGPVVAGVCGIAVAGFAHAMGFAMAEVLDKLDALGQQLRRESEKRDG